MKAYLLPEMTWPEVEAALETVEVAIVPVGAHEQHGPHLHEDCDAVLATEYAKRLTTRLHPHALMTPTINFGLSQHHMNFPGTITLQPETLISIMRDVVSSLRHHGIRKFLFLSGHTGNVPALNIGCHKLSSEMDVEAYYAKTSASAKEAIEKHIHSPLFGHSCEREVSEALYLAPHLINREQLTKGAIREEGRWRMLRPGNPIQGPYRYEEMTTNGAIGDATRSSYAAGRDIAEESLDKLESALRNLLLVGDQ
jgi:creatinine amidohydrolase